MKLGRPISTAHGACPAATDAALQTAPRALVPDQAAAPIWCDTATAFVPNRAYAAQVASFRDRAAWQGIASDMLTLAFRSAGFVPGVITRDRNQTEFTRTLEDYLSISVSEESVAKGRTAFARHRGTLAALEDRYGIDAEIITAIWGVESFYGERWGDVPVI